MVSDKSKIHAEKLKAKYMLDGYFMFISGIVVLAQSRKQTLKISIARSIDSLMWYDNTYLELRAPHTISKYLKLLQQQEAIIFNHHELEYFTLEEHRRRELILRLAGL